MTCEPRWAARVDAALVGEHGGALYAEVRAHLEGCPACAAFWNESARRLAAIEARPARLPEAVEAAVLSRVFEALDVDEGAVSPAATVVRPTPGRAWGRPALVALAIAAGAALFVATPRGPDAGTEPVWAGFQPRGGGNDAPGIQAFCVAPDPGAAKVSSAANSGLAEPVQCGPGARLQFAYSTPSSTAARHLSLFATGPDGEFVWYWPRGNVPFEAVPGARSEALPGSFEVSAVHRAGRWRITGVFTSEAVERSLLEDLARRGGEARVAAWASEQGNSVNGAGLWLEVAEGAQAPGGEP